MGLVDYLNTPSFVTLDFDRDGDLDIISQRVAANHGVFINQAQAPGVFVDLREGGRPVLSASVSLLNEPSNNKSSDDKSMPQLSQQVLGGGFLAFDQPLAHFGMAAQKSYNTLEIRWPNALQERLRFSIEAGNYYLLEQDTSH